jgi:hypothetical protein
VKEFDLIASYLKRLGLGEQIGIKELLMVVL